MDSPKISVLMSCYNATTWLHESIGSVLNQTYRNFEFIIIDDGSKDDTLAIVRQYAANDDRIIVIAKPNTGLADSLNIGISKARGEWIARQDADDVSEPSRLEKQVQFARTNPSLVFIGTGLTEIDEFGHKLSTYRYPLEHCQLVKYLTTAQKFPPHSSAFYRSEVVRSIAGYRQRICRAEDADLWLRLSEIGGLACLDEPLVKIRIHANQISHADSGRRQLIDSRVAMASYWLRKQGVSDPVDADDETFNAFYVWLEQELIGDGLFEFQNQKIRVKIAFRRKKSCVSDWLSLSAALVSHPLLLFRFLHEHLTGDSTAARLASKWIKIQK